VDVRDLNALVYVAPDLHEMGAEEVGKTIDAIRRESGRDVRTGPSHEALWSDIPNPNG